MKRKYVLMLFLATSLPVWFVLQFGQDAIIAQESAHKKPLPPGPLGEMIKLGEELVQKTATHPLSRPFVGNALSCTSCHLKNGTDPRAASFIDIATAYPAWSPREKRVITLEDRILNCFMRSCHGTRPPLGSKVSVAIAAYITWLSDGKAMHMNAKKSNGPRALERLNIKANAGNPDRGAQIYSAQCAQCHGKDGLGSRKNPPVWGPKSYNRGAGLSGNDSLAAWLKVAMPLDEANLSDRDAIDLAVFINSKDRPAFRLAEHLPPGDKLGEYNAESPPQPK